MKTAIDASSSIRTPPANGRMSGIIGTIDSTASFSTAALWAGSTGVGVDIQDSSLRKITTILSSGRSGGIQAFPYFVNSFFLSALFGCLKTRVSQRSKHGRKMGAAASLQHQFDFNVLRGQHCERPLMMNLIDVGARFGDGRGNLGQ